jgi:pilus assembly protein TadC
MVYPRELSEVEQLIRDIDSDVSGQQSKEGEETIKLPESVNGVTLGWTESGEHLTLKVILLEALILVLLPMLSRSREKETAKKRQDELMLYYPDMVSKFNVLVGAGMTIKQAWHTISAQYLDKREKNATRESLTFEELVKTDREIRDGESERIAYQRFGERTGISSYRRFVRMLISNLQKGNRGLCEQLEQESETAFAERRLLAKRLGEEAGTKLLFPMILMLGMVIVIIIVPAMQGFSM